MPLDEIARLEALQDAEINEAKKILATEATAMVHGREAAERAADTARQTFQEGVVAASLPSVILQANEIPQEGLGVLAAFVKAGLVTSTGEARRQIKGGGLRLNDQPITDEKAIITIEAIEAGAKLSLGRKKHVLLRLADGWERSIDRQFHSNEISDKLGWDSQRRHLHACERGNLLSHLHHERTYQNGARCSYAELVTVRFHVFNNVYKPTNVHRDIYNGVARHNPGDSVWTAAH